MTLSGSCLQLGYGEPHSKKASKGPAVLHCKSVINGLLFSSKGLRHGDDLGFQLLPIAIPLSLCSHVLPTLLASRTPKPGLYKLHVCEPRNFTTTALLWADLPEGSCRFQSWGATARALLLSTRRPPIARPNRRHSLVPCLRWMRWTIVARRVTARMATARVDSMTEQMGGICSGRTLQALDLIL